MRSPGDPALDRASDGPGLSPAGQARAQAYIGYFEDFQATDAKGGHTKPATPRWVFATADNPVTSYRPRLTVSPFADAALVPLSSCVTDKHYGDLVKQLCGDKAFDDTTILICRHHGKIIELANALLTDNDTSAMPKLSSASCWPTAWPSAGFDPTPVRSSR